MRPDSLDLTLYALACVGYTAHALALLPDGPQRLALTVAEAMHACDDGRVPYWQREWLGTWRGGWRS